MRILFVSNFYPPHIVGGAELVAHRHVAGLQARGHHVSVLAGRAPTPEAPPGTLAVEQQDTMGVYRLSLTSLEPDANFYNAAVARRFRSVVSAESPDVVHFHNLTGLGANLIAEAHRLGLPSIITLHDHWGFCFKNTRLRDDNTVCRNVEDCFQCHDRIRATPHIDLPMRVRRDYVAWCLALADKRVAPSRYLADAYMRSRLGFGAVSYRTNGIDLDRFAGCATRTTEPHAAVRFAAIGYLGEHKGLKVLLRAAELLGQRSDLTRDWSLRIAGAGHLEPWLKAEIATGRYGNSVTYLGKVSPEAIAPLLAESDVAVLASIWPENEPVVMLEAIAAGIAQIATDHGGNRELVEDGASGWLVAPNDAEALSAAMATYVTNIGLAEAHGSRNLKRRAAFDVTATIAGYEKDYNALATTPAKRTPTEDVVVICVGAPSDAIRHLVNALPALLDTDVRIRLIYEAWVCPLAWRQAAAVWIWSEQSSDAQIQAALRHKVPVIAGRGHVLARAIEEVHGLALTYGDLAEAVAMLTVIARNSATMASRLTGAPKVADMLSQITAPGTYQLAAERTPGP